MCICVWLEGWEEDGCYAAFPLRSEIQEERHVMVRRRGDVLSPGST